MAGILAAAYVYADPAPDIWFPTTVNNQYGLTKLLELAKADQLAVLVGDDLTPGIFR